MTSADETPETTAGGSADGDPFTGPGWDRARPEPADTTSDGSAVRRVRTRTKRRRSRRRVLLGTGVLALVLLAAVAWLLVTGLKARTQLEAVRSEVRQLRSEIATGDLGAARATARELGRHARDAHHLTTGPVWSVAAAVPYLGAPAETVRALTSGVDSLAGGALPSLIDASQNLDPGKLRRPDGSVELAPIARAAPVLDRAAASMQQVTGQIERAPSSTWLGTVDAARDDVQGQLRGLTSTVVSADVAGRTLPALLGADGPKSYFVSFQNEAELRGLGGLPGAFAILRTDHGKIRFTGFQSDNAILRVDSGLDFGADYAQLYGQADPTKLYVNSTVSPHFPYAARIWLAQWQRKTGQQLDGAITLDPTAVSYLLAVSGPARLPDGTVVTARNVVRLTQQTAYDRFASNNAARKRFLLDIARTVSGKLIDSRTSSTSMVRAAAKAVGEHRLLVYSADPALEAQLRRTTISGIVARTTAPYIGLGLNNSMAGKLDYYLTASLRWRRSGCGSTRDVTVTVRLTNHASSKLPNYVLGYYGRPGFPKHKGDNAQLVDYAATTGARMVSVELNGRPTGARIGGEQGHPVYALRLALPRGSTQTIVFHLKEPAGSGSPVVRAQPMINPLAVSVTDPACS